MQKLFATILSIVAFMLMGFVQLVMATEYPQMPAGTYIVDKTHASLTWKVSHLGLSNYTARFKTFDAEFQFDPNSPEKSTLHASINPLSIETDYPYSEDKDFNKELSTGEGWFNANKFPTITFNASKVELTDQKHGKIHGELTFLGVTKPLTLNVTLNNATEKQPFSRKPTFGFSATTKLQRSEWGMDAYLPNIGDEVTVQIEAEFALKG